MRQSSLFFNVLTVVLLSWLTFSVGCSSNSDEQVKALSMEIDTLKKDLAKSLVEPKIVFKSRSPEELTKALVNTKWQDPGFGEIAFPEAGKSIGWGGSDPGTWTVAPDGTIKINWSSGFVWTMMVNDDLTVAVAAGHGNPLKRVK